MANTAGIERPWSTTKNPEYGRDNPFFAYFPIWSENGTYIGAAIGQKGGSIQVTEDQAAANAALIVEAVNQRDALQAENEALIFGLKRLEQFALAKYGECPSMPHEDCFLSMTRQLLAKGGGAK